jgi:hypothetical protein
MLLGGILEFFLGNTFSFVVFCSFGGFWLTLGSTLTPAFNAYGAYAPPDPTTTTAGITSTGFHASFGFFLLFMGLLCFMYLICALRTNIVFVTIFLGLFLTFVVLTGSYWQLALGHTQTAARLQIVSSQHIVSINSMLEANLMIYKGSRGVWVHGLHGRMVDLLRANARLCGLSIPDPGWGYQSYHQGWEYETSGEGAVQGLDA